MRVEPWSSGIYVFYKKWHQEFPSWLSGNKPDRLVSMRIRVQSLASLSSLIAVSCGIGCRCHSDPLKKTKKETPESSLSAAWRPERRWDPWARKRALTRTQPCQHPDIRPIASRTVRNECLLFKPPGLWYFVIAAQVKTLISCWSG